MACCPLLLLEKVAAGRAPPAPLSLCSQTLSERAGRFVLADKEGPQRERRHESASARPGGALAGVVLCTGGVRLRVAGGTVAFEGALSAQGHLYCFTHPMDPT